MGKLNSKQLENLTEPGTYEDGDGLRIVVKASGRKSWVLRFQLNGKRREMGLGAFPEVSLKAARLEASAKRSQLLAGTDPLAARNAEREALRTVHLAEIAETVTFDELAADYIAAHRAGWKNVKHAQQWKNTLKTYASPVIGKLSANDVTTGHILEVLNKNDFWSNKPETASRVRNRIELVLDAAKARGMREGENPARWRGHLDKLLPGSSKIKKVKHHPALPYPELPDFLDHLRQRDGIGARALEFTVLTAVRSGEIRAAEWHEIDLEARAWTIPAERMKANKEHRVPLSDEAVALLEALPRIAGNNLVFPATRGKQMSDMTLAAVIKRMHMAELEAGRRGYIDPKQRDNNGDYRMVTPHGFRSGFRDWAGECTAHPRDVCEQALAHTLGNAVEAAYRRGDLFEKRRALMTDWAAYCTSKPAHNVIQGDFKRA